MYNFNKNKKYFIID